MSSRSINRKDFLVITVSSAAIATFLQACGGDDPVPSTGGAGTGGTGTAGTGTAGTGTAGTGTAGTTSGGSAGSGSGGSSAGSGGSSAGSGGSSAGSGGSSGGSGGSSGGSGGSGGGAGGMCGTVSIMQTSTEQHDHIPADATALKADLKMLINGAMSTMEFTLPSDGQGAGHVHKIKLDVAQVTTLKGGGMVTMWKTIADDTNHTHTYTIGCGA